MSKLGAIVAVIRRVRTDQDAHKRRLNGHGDSLPVEVPAAVPPRAGFGRLRPLLVIVTFVAVAFAIWGVAKDNSLDWPEMFAGVLALACGLLFYRIGGR